MECPLLNNSVNASGCGFADGLLPADHAENLPLPTSFKIASHIIDRAELPVQRNKTFNG